MAKITLAPILAAFASAVSINQKNSDIAEHLNDKVLYRDNPSGEANEMKNDLDMNSNRILNLPSATTTNEPITYGQYVSGAEVVDLTGTSVSEELSASADGQTLYTLSVITYTQGSKNLSVYRNGVRLPHSSYVETSTSSITLTDGSAIKDGDEFEFVVNERDISTDMVLDSNVQYTPAGSGAVVSDVQTKLRESVTPADFGAVGDGVTDDYAALYAMKEYANSERMMVLDGSKTYAVGTEWDLRHSVNTSIGPKLQGNNATIIALGAMANVVSISGVTKLNTLVSDLIIDADNLATQGFFASFVVEMNSTVRNIKVLRALAAGQVYDGCQVARFEGLVSELCVGDGFNLESCNGALFEGLRGNLNGGDGAKVQRGTTNFSGGCTVSNFDFEGNDGNGLVVVDTVTPVVTSGLCWAEGNDLDGVLIQAAARNVSIQNVNIIGTDQFTPQRAVRIEDGAVGCTVRHNLFNKLGGSTDAFSVVEDENTSNTSLNDVGSNYFGTAVKRALSSRDAYLNDEVVHQLTSVNTVGKGGYLTGGESFTISAAGSITLTFQPYGTFNIAGSNDRGAYAITLKMIGSLVGYDETVYKEFIIYASTGNSIDHDQSSTEVQSIGDSTRKGSITAGTPAVSGVNAISVVISNADDSDYTGYFSWDQMMTTEGTLVLTVT